jgi:hypothetical protein
MNLFNDNASLLDDSAVLNLTELCGVIPMYDLLIPKEKPVPGTHLLYVILCHMILTINHGGRRTGPVVFSSL